MIYFNTVSPLSQQQRSRMEKEANEVVTTGKWREVYCRKYSLDMDPSEVQKDEADFYATALRCLFEQGGCVQELRTETNQVPVI